MILIFCALLLLGGGATYAVRRWLRKRSPRQILMDMLMADRAWSKKESKRAINAFERSVGKGLLDTHGEDCEYVQMFWELSQAVRLFLEPYVIAKELQDAVQQSFEIKDGLILYDDAFAEHLAAALMSHTRRLFYRGQINSLVADQWDIAADLINPNKPGPTVWKKD